MATSSAANFLAELWESIPRGWPRVVVVGVPLALPVALLDAIDKGAVASWAFASIVWLVGIGTYVLRQRSEMLRGRRVLGVVGGDTPAVPPVLVASLGDVGSALPAAPATCAVDLGIVPPLTELKGGPDKEASTPSGLGGFLVVVAFYLLEQIGTFVFMRFAMPRQSVFESSMYMGFVVSYGGLLLEFLRRRKDFIDGFAVLFGLRVISIVVMNVRVPPESIADLIQTSVALFYHGGFALYVRKSKRVRNTFVH